MSAAVSLVTRCPFGHPPHMLNRIISCTSLPQPYDFDMHTLLLYVLCPAGRAMPAWLCLTVMI
jgi:hypothetical protein